MHAALIQKGWLLRLKLMTQETPRIGGEKAYQSTQFSETSTVEIHSNNSAIVVV